MLATRFLSVVRVLLVSAVSFAIPRGWEWDGEGVGMLANLLLLSVWSLFALRRFHRSSWWRCAVAAALITVAWIPTVIGYRFALFWVV